MFAIVSRTAQFKQDYKRCKTRHYEMALIDGTIILIVQEASLPESFRKHKLSGEYKDCWECHIKPDWLLIWKEKPRENTVVFIRTGTHSDLFG